LNFISKAVKSALLDNMSVVFLLFFFVFADAEQSQSLPEMESKFFLVRIPILFELNSP
jgi:hypothetical protein